MPIDRYIKQPLALSLPQYIDLELRKIESAIFSASEFSDLVQAEVDQLQIDTAALQAEAWTRSIIKPSDTSTANDNTVNPDPHLILPLTTGVWDIESGMIASNAVAGIAIAYNHMFSGTILSAPVSHGGTGALAAIYDTITGPGATAFTFVLTAAPSRKTVTFRFIIDVQTAGNLTLNWSQGASNASPTVLHKGSYLRARKLI
jgi:hypothetical protein